jgi:hypothetical protein
MNTQCRQLDNWLQAARDPRAEALPPETLIDHLQTCARCRAALLIHASDPAQAGHTPLDTPCETVGSQLAAFVDYERMYGPLAAAHAFPQVWWHSLACPSCAELHATLHELAGLPYEPWQPAVFFLPRSLNRPRLRFQIAALRRLLGAQQRLGVAWSLAQPDLVLAEADAAEATLRLYLRHQSPSLHLLVLRTEPPQTGTALLDGAGTSLRAVLDRQGLAVFELPAEDVLAAATDSSLTVTVEPPTDPAAA